MSQLLKYSEVDSFIQRKLRNSAPSSTTRLEAVKDALQDIYAEYDIDSGIREKFFYIVPNGEDINISDDVTDYKKAKDLRLIGNNHTKEFTELADDIFVTHIGQNKKLNEYSINYNDGKLFMKINSLSGYSSLGLHGMTALTSDGTWSASEDAINIAVEDVTLLEQQYNIKFDIDVSNSANDYAVIENSTVSAINLEDYLNAGKIRFWIYLPSVTEFTSVEARWGDDSSNYWSNTATTQLNGTALTSGWNRIEIDWDGATKTGSPDETSVNYLAIKLNYTSSYTDQQSVRVEALNIYLPKPFKLLYYTYYTSIDSSGNVQEDPTTTTGDEILLPKRFKTLVGTKACIELAPISFGESADKMVRGFEAEFYYELKKLGIDGGNKPRTPERKLKLQSQW